MEYFIGFFVIFLLLIFICLLFPVRIYISYKKSEGETISTLDVKYMFIKFRIYPDGKPKKEKPPKEKKTLEERKTKLEEYKAIFEGISPAIDVRSMLSSTKRTPPAIGRTAFRFGMPVSA